MQTKDIPDKLILEVLADHQGHWAFWWDDHTLTWPSEDNGSVETRIPVFTEGTPYGLMLAKWRSLAKRGLIGGCTCGCRGDFEITDKGLEAVGRTRTRPYNGY